MYQPAPSFTLTADFYRIEVKDRIIISGDLEPAKNPNLPSSVRTAFEAADVTVGQFFMNAADTETRGMDVVASWNVPFINRGDLELNFLGALMQTKSGT